MTVRTLLGLLVVAGSAGCAPGASAPAPSDTDAASLAQGAEPAAAWWAHVSYLSGDDMRGRETGSPEHRKAANYVADQLTKAGVAPAGTNGFLQPVTFRSRKIDEANSSLTLVRRGKETPLVLGEDAGFGMRIDPAPSVEAPLVFAGHGLVIPEVGARRLRRPRRDRQGRGLPGRQPQRTCRGAQRALPVGRGPLGDPEAARRDRHDRRRQSRRAWTCRGNARSPNRLNAAMALADASLDDAAGQQVSIDLQPGQGRAAVRRARATRLPKC